MAGYLKNSLINSNNLLGSNVNISTKKSIIKSDSKIKTKNKIASQKDNQNSSRIEDNNTPNKPKTVKISPIPR